MAHEVGGGAPPPLEKTAAEAERHPGRGRSRGGRQLEVDFGGFKNRFWY